MITIYSLIAMAIGWVVAYESYTVGLPLSREYFENAVMWTTIALMSLGCTILAYRILNAEVKDGT